MLPCSWVYNLLKLFQGTGGNQPALKNDEDVLTMPVVCQGDTSIS